LAPSLDSVGPLAPSVACCAAIDGILAGEGALVPAPVRLAGLRFAVPENVVLEGMDTVVSAAFERALSALSAAGAAVTRVRFPEFDELPVVNAKGGFAASEAYAWHRSLLASKGAGYDPNIRVRIARGEGMSAADCVLMPTVPIIAPRVSDLSDQQAYNRINMLILRNTALGNFLDRCSIGVPCHREGEAPVGLMLTGETMGDARLFSIAAAVESAVR
jgi:aspartyl-tRNA(Asn)/glutamyl-tRNA(Gln) amidotransferase subunit A